MKGKVKWFNTEKGYGFIEGDDKESYFVHISQIIPDEVQLNEGDEVKFTDKMTYRGKQAVNVQVI